MNTISVLERRLTEFYGTSPLASATRSPSVNGARLTPLRPIQDEPLRLAEVYWAYLPRNAIAGGDFRFADTHQWVRTILARLYRDAPFQDYKQAETSLDYLLSSLVQLQRFTKLPETLGIVQWSLAMILFDLTIVWHLFVRSGGAMQAVREARIRSSQHRFRRLT